MCAITFFSLAFYFHIHWYFFALTISVQGSWVHSYFGQLVAATCLCREIAKSSPEQNYKKDMAQISFNLFPWTCGVISLSGILKFWNTLSGKMLQCPFLNTQHWNATSILFCQDRYRVWPCKLSGYNSFDMFVNASFHHEREAGHMNGLPANFSPLFHLCLGTYHLQDGFAFSQ